jgi:phytoene/squalene synthetase
MDINKKRFETFSELLFYCDHSANPVGELILRLHKIHSPATQTLSNHICTALQLINFLQDIHEDYSLRDRIYIPQDEMEKFAVTEDNIRSKANSDNLSQLVNFQLIRAMDMLLAGVPLIAYLHGRLKWVIKLTIISALCVCEKLSRREDVFTRPVLNRAEWLNILLRTLYFRPDMTRAKIKNNMTIRTSL